MATKEGVIVTYDTQNKDAVKPIIEKLANDFNIGGGGKISVNGAEVSNISITGAEVTFVSDTAIVNIEVNPQKLNPQLTLSANAVTVGGSFGSATVDAQYLSTAGLSAIGGTVLNPNQVEISSAYIDTVSTAYIFALEDADYYQQFKPVQVTTRTTIIDMHIENGAIVDSSGHVWTQYGEPEFLNDAVHFQGRQYIATELTESELLPDNFSAEGTFYIPNGGAGTWAGIVSAMRGFPEEPDGIAAGFLLQLRGQQFWTFASFGLNSWAFQDTAKDGLNANQDYDFKFERRNGVFTAWLDGVQIWTSTAGQGSPLYHRSNFVICGANLGQFNGNFYLKNLRIRKF